MPSFLKSIGCDRSDFIKLEKHVRVTNGSALDARPVARKKRERLLFK
jgi:hypothetical protein